MLESAILHDGKSARGRFVKWYVDEDNLIITGPDGSQIIVWPVGSVILVGNPSDGQPPRLRSGWKSTERLTLNDDFALDGLALSCPNLYRNKPSWTGHGRRVFIWAGAAIASIIFLVAVAIPSIATSIAHGLNEQTQRKIGRTVSYKVVEALALAEKNSKTVGELTCNREPGSRRLNGIVDQLRFILPENRSINIRVIDLNVSNAFALPGGQILVFRGLLDDLESANELAGIIAHELAHVYYKHPSELFLRETGIAVMIGFLFGDITGGWMLAGATRLISGAAHSRAAEIDADKLAIKLMNSAGWDIRPLSNFFERIHRKKGSMEQSLSLFMTHPLSKNRASVITAGANANGEVLTPKGWYAVKTICGNGAGDVSFDVGPKIRLEDDRQICLGANRYQLEYTMEAKNRGLTKYVCSYAEGYWQYIPSGMHSQSTNKAICTHALERSRNNISWDTGAAVLPSVLEAKRRGLSLDECERAIMGRDRLSDLGEYAGMVVRGQSDQEICEGSRRNLPEFVEEAKNRGLTDEICLYSSDGWKYVPNVMRTVDRPELICRMALVRTRQGVKWDTNPHMRRWVLQAKFQGLTIESCRRHAPEIDFDRTPDDTSGQAHKDQKWTPTPSEYSMTPNKKLMIKFLRVSDKEICDRVVLLEQDAIKEARRRNLDNRRCRALPPAGAPDVETGRRLGTISLTDLCAGVATGNPNYEFEAKRRGVKPEDCQRTQ